MKEDYRKLLNSKEWDEKRKVIYKRDKYACTCCGVENVELHAHHRFYFSGLLIKPWEYSDEDIITLCESCHDSVHVFFKEEGINQYYNIVVLSKDENGLPIYSYEALDFNFKLPKGFGYATIGEMSKKDKKAFRRFVVFSSNPLSRRLMNEFFELPVDSVLDIGYLKKRNISTEQTVTKKVSGYVEVDMGYAQVYEGIVRAFDKLNSVCALKLLPFLLFEMNDTNMVSFDRFLIKKFNKQFSDSFHERTIRNAMTELVKVGVVHKIQNGKYVIDARYCWIGDTVKRLDFIKNFESWKRDKLIGEADGIEIETSIDGDGSNLVEIAPNKDKLI